MFARSAVAVAICLGLAGNAALAALQFPDGSTWGLKDAYAGAFKIGISTFANKQFLNDPVRFRVCMFVKLPSCRMRATLRTQRSPDCLHMRNDARV